MELKPTEHIKNTIFFFFISKKQKTNKQKQKQKNKQKQNNKQTNKQKTDEIPIFGTFLVKKKSILANISRKIDIFRSAMLYYVFVTSYVDRFS